MQLQHFFFPLVLLCLFYCFLESKGDSFKMSADIYNSLVFCVSTEAVGPQQLECH